MPRLTRRKFTALTGASLAGACVPLFAPRALGQAKPKLVVIGGGPGGGTVARYVNKDAAGAIDVTLIEPQAKFTTCFFSNLYVGGFRNFASITHDYDKVARGACGSSTTAPARSTASARRCGSPAARRVPYDRLVVAPGIDLKFDSVPGYSEAAAETMPHAWQAGAQTQLLDRSPQCAGRRRSHRHDRAAQPVPLPARPLRARLDVRARAQAQGPQALEDHRRSIPSPPSPNRRCSWRAGRSTTRA